MFVITVVSALRIEEIPVFPLRNDSSEDINIKLSDTR